MRARVATAVTVVAVLAVTAGAALAVVHRAQVRPGYTGDGDLVTILAIGSDIGPPQRPGDPLRGRADAIHLVAVDPESGAATIVDIPRDSVVGGDKVNAFLATSGPEGLREALAEFTGVEIDFWALTTFQGLIDLVDDAGGVEIDVDQRLRDADAKSDIEPGLQTLSGSDALAFTRDRKSLSDGDFGRTRHQGEFLIAAHEGVRSRNLVQLAQLLASFSRNTVTDIPREDLLPLALLATQIDPNAVEQVPLEGMITTSGAESVVQLQPGDVFERIAAGEVGPRRAGSTEGN